MTIPIPPFLLAGAPSLSSQFIDAVRQYLTGIHHLEFFDWAIMVPYFAVLAVLSVYGLHRYETIRGYMKHHKRMAAAPPPMRFTELPRVTIQLPIFNERFVVERLLEETAKMDYPRHLLQIQVLDDSTDDTHKFTEELVREYRDSGLPIEYIHRTNRYGYKAGALENGLKTATAWLPYSTPIFFHPRISSSARCIISPIKGRRGSDALTYLNRGTTYSPKKAILLDGHFVLEHVARAGGLFFNFNDCGHPQIMIRMRADGNVALTEVRFDYRGLKGWKFVYVLQRSAF